MTMLVSRTQILLATKTAVAAGIAWAVALLADPHGPAGNAWCSSERTRRCEPETGLPSRHGRSADRQRLADATRAAGETFGRAVARAQRRWRDDPAHG
jgi:hypothetical protein